MISAKRKRLVLLLVLGVLLGILLLVTSPLIVNTGPDRTPRAARLQSGTELILVLLGSSGCGASRTPGFPEAIDSLVGLLSRAAQMDGFQFSVIGVAVDPSIADGLKFLNRFHGFDEVLVGHGWLNSGAVKYVWQDLGGSAVLPQVLLVRRDVLLGRTGVQVTSERTITRVIGVRQILDWVQSARVETLRSGWN